MLKALIAMNTVKPKLTSGKLTKDNITKTSVLPSLEGFLGNVFKSKENILKETREKEESDIDGAESHFTTNLFPDIVKYSKDNTESFVTKFHEISEKIKGKKLNSQKFEDLTFTKTELKFKVISDGLYKIGLVHAGLDQVIREAESIDVNTIDQKTLHKTLWNLPEKLQINNKTDSYFAFNGFQSLHHIATKEDYGHGYSVEKGVKVSSAGYSSDFVTHTISEVNSVVNSIHAFYPYCDKFKEYCNQAKEKISKMTDHTHMKNPYYVVEFIGLIIWSAINATADEYLKEAVNVAEYIVTHCYE